MVRRLLIVVALVAAATAMPGLAGADDTTQLHNFTATPPACAGDGGITWSQDSIGIPSYELTPGTYRNCLEDFNPTAGTVTADYVGTVSDYGQTWDKINVTVSPGATIAEGPPGGPTYENVAVGQYDFLPSNFQCSNGTVSAPCAPDYPFEDAADLTEPWSATDMVGEMHPQVAIPSSEFGSTSPSEFPASCGFGSSHTTNTCTILVDRPTALQNGQPYWYRITAYGMGDFDNRTVQVKDLLIESQAGQAANPVARITAQNLPAGSLTWSFDGSGSSGGNGQPIDTYAWTFGDGKTGSGATVSHTYTDAGTYTVGLTVTDHGGKTANAAQTITVTTPHLIVNSTGDAAATDPSVSCATGGTVGSAPECTLRSAIQAADAGGGSAISFAIPGGGTPTIAVGSALPAVTKGVDIDGRTQSGGWVELTGTTGDGLTLQAANASVEGLAIGGFAGAGVLVDHANHASISGDRIGTDATGAVARPVGFGVTSSGSTGVTIGGSTAATGDQIVTSGGIAVQVAGSGAGGGADSSAGTTVSHDLIGTNADGSAALGTASPGVVVSGDTAGDATTTVSDNVIAGSSAGVAVIAPAPTGRR